jgi:hypothetical protein
MMSVVSAMSVVHFMSLLTARVLCLYLPTNTHTTDTTHINNLITRARARSVDNFEGSPQSNPAATATTARPRCLAFESRQ